MGKQQRNENLRKGRFDHRLGLFGELLVSLNLAFAYDEGC
jgi:hypothetical protein